MCFSGYLDDPYVRFKELISNFNKQLETKTKEDLLHFREPFSVKKKCENDRKKLNKTDFAELKSVVKLSIQLFTATEDERYECKSVNVNDSFVRDASDIKKKMKLSGVESPNSDRPLNSELMTSIAEMKGKFAETLISLDLVESFYQCPSEETAQQLKHLFGHEHEDKSHQHFTHKNTKFEKGNPDRRLAEPLTIPEESLQKEIRQDEFCSTQNESPRQRILRLQKNLESLEIENELLFLELVETTEREKETRKSKAFERIYRSSFRSPKPQITSKTSDATVNSAVVTAPSDGEQSVLGAEALVPASNNRQQRKEVGSSSFALKERASGGEGNNESENDKASSVLASASEEGIALSFSVQQDYSNETEYISLHHIPLQSVATLLYTNYKLLLVSQSQLLLSSDVMKLMDWAAQNFSIENTRNPTDVLLQLDKKGVINASDLSALRNFFESIVRFDLVYIIDEFLLGDYTLLHKISVMKKRDATKALQNPQHASRYTRALSSLRQTSLQGSTSARSAASSVSLRMITDPATLRKPENSNGAQSFLPQPRHEPLFPNTSTLSNANNPKPASIISNENQSSVQQQNLKSTASGFTEQSVVVVNGPIANERRTTAANPSTRKNASVTNSARNTQKFGNDSSKLSKSQPPESSVVSHTHHHDASGNPDLELESNWLCSHYKRHCYVKFECCDKFWPCHRCHNNQSTCGQKKLKSRDTQMVKCVYCKKVQPFGQFCCNCAAKFSSYFCGMCKHLTGNDDHPYHCDKCGICRIHGDRSFHCDVCGVCLDVQLRGNHKCRAGSAHDECCICLEDAFTGCQILPCSHKVHKECATQMIRSGITRCPICRESFAHKLERRPLQSRKRSGK